MEIDSAIVEIYCDEANDLLSRWETIIIQLSKQESKEAYEELFRIAHNLKGGSRSVGLLAYGDLVHKIEDGITLLRDEKIKLNPELLTLLFEAQKILSDWTAQLKINSHYTTDCTAYLKEIDTHFFNKVVDTSEPEVHLIQKTSVAIEQEKNPTEQPVIINTAKNSLEKKKPSQNISETIRISAQKLDELIQIIGELSIHQSIVWHTRTEGNSNNKIFNNSLQLGHKLTKELYDKALSLRMQPLQSVFQRLERSIFELSRNLGKDVDVDIIGGDVELDKTVVERIIDPLTHIVRNAIDHGIELPEVRRQKEKSAKGKIKISARQDTFGVELIIKDDGKGLSIDKIRNKAIEKGLIQSHQNLSDKEIFNLIFLPGFSTAEKITDVSGRGVGMDVVRRTLEELQGQIQIDSIEGNGSTFTITMPTSVSIIEALLITLSGQNYAIPLGVIDEVIDLDESYDLNNIMMKHNDHVLPVQGLEGILVNKRIGKSSQKSNKLKQILVCKYQNKKLGLAIEKVTGRQQVVIRPLNDNINGAFGVMGGTILGNGEPGIIIDVPSIINNFVSHIEKMGISA